MWRHIPISAHTRGKWGQNLEFSNAIELCWKYVFTLISGWETQRWSFLIFLRFQPPVWLNTGKMGSNSISSNAIVELKSWKYASTLISRWEIQQYSQFSIFLRLQSPVMTSLYHIWSNTGKTGSNSVSSKVIVDL